jgi:16S rRNA (cytosine967-C5)-methyltransferase
VGTGAERPATVARRRPVSPARACAFAVIRRVFEHGAYADRVLHAEAAGLDPRERALAMALSYGTIQRRATLDYVAAKLASRPLDALDPPVLAALRLGLFQLLYLGGVAEYAAVNESVELVKRTKRGGATLVNAVLRRAAGDGRAILDELDERDPRHAALLHSVPDWLAERWWEELGPDAARALLRRVNEPAESALRVNGLVATARAVAARLPVGAQPALGLPEGLVLDAPFDAHASELSEQGVIMPQSRGSMLVARVLAPRPGDRVLDLCAAPGAKTTHLAALMADEGELVAVERHRGRADALVRTCRRMHVGCARVEVGDARRPRTELPYGRVLADPPCSGLGTLQSRPDLRWHASPAAVSELAVLQAQILAVAGAATAPRGVLVYSVCTISRLEGEAVVDRFLRSSPDFVADDLQAEYPDWKHPRAASYLQLLPHRDHTDGFFIARLRRRGPP